MRAVVVSLVVVLVGCKRVEDTKTQFRVTACQGVGGVAEPCELLVNKEACESAPCTKLLVMFSRGVRGCTHDDKTVLEGYAKHGWAGVCIGAFGTPRNTRVLTYVDEAPRYDLALREAIALTKPHWTGADLLFYGIGHGASTPLIAIARTDLETAEHWRGTGRTAVCLLDGSYDQHATAELLRTGSHTRFGPSPCASPISYHRWIEPYCPGKPDTCDLRTEPAAMRDTITTAPLAGFGIRDYRLVECGSERRPICDGDALPAAPIAAMCKHLDDSPAHTCTFAAHPKVSYPRCQDLADDCRTWFDALGAQPSR